MKLPILDVSDVGLIEQSAKIREEYRELQLELIKMKNDKENYERHRLAAVAEALDGLTTYIHMIGMLTMDEKECETEFEKHYEKLGNRDRAIVAEIEIKIKKLRYSKIVEFEVF